MNLKKLLPAICIILCACSENFTDPRDGQSYDMVQIGSQTWMAENLNFETAGSFCPDGDSRNCSKFGRLYTWDAAMSACPEGWRLPTREDFDALIAAALLANNSAGASSADNSGASSADKSGEALKATSGWFKKGNGTDDTRFAALPAGYMSAAESANESAPVKQGKFDGIGGYAYFWSATLDPQEAAFAQYLFLDFASPVAQINSFDKNSARSVRCVRANSSL